MLGTLATAYRKEEAEAERQRRRWASGDFSSDEEPAHPEQEQVGVDLTVGREASHATDPRQRGGRGKDDDDEDEMRAEEEVYPYDGGEGDDGAPVAAHEGDWPPQRRVTAAEAVVRLSSFSLDAAAEAIDALGLPE